MAQQIIEAAVPCYLLASDFTAAYIATLRNDPSITVPVYLADSNNTDGIPTVGIAQGNAAMPNVLTTRVYGKLDTLASSWDVLGTPTVDANGNVTYPNMADVIVAGVVTFTGLLKDITTGAALAPTAEVGKQIKGFSGGTGSPPAPAGSLVPGDATGVTTGQTGRIVARDGNAPATSTIWVDLRAS